MSYVDIIIDAAMRSFDINGIGICNSAVAIETSFFFHPVCPYSNLDRPCLLGPQPQNVN